MKFQAVVAGFAFLTFTGCGTPVPEVAVGQPVSYATHLEALVVARCLGCHDSEEAKAKLVLEPGTGYERLVGPRSVQDPEMALVESGDPERSYLWLKLQHVTEKGKGMPRTATGVKKLREAELDLYRRWIDGGAKP